MDKENFGITFIHKDNPKAKIMYEKGTLYVLNGNEIVGEIHIKEDLGIFEHSKGVTNVIEKL